MKIRGANELLLFEILNSAWPGLWEREHKGIEGRKFRFDVACPSHKVAIEVEGGIFAMGRHNRPLGYLQDMLKYNMAVIEGWRILRYDPETLVKQPWKIKADISQLIGCPTTTNQLDFAHASFGTQVQQKISEQPQWKIVLNGNITQREGDAHIG